MDSLQIDVCLDTIDITLLKHVESNREMDLGELADEFDLSKSAIHYRLNKLKANDVITSVSADVNPLQLGLTILVITEVYASHESDYAKDIGKSLSKINGVFQVYYTMGDVDFMIISRAQSREQINTTINEIVSVDGVNKTSSQFVMEEVKTSDKTVQNMSEEMINNVVEL